MNRWVLASLALVLAVTACKKTSSRPDPHQLNEAVQANDPKRVASLLERGANPNARDDLDRGGTVLELAAWNGATEIVGLLLKHGADPHTTVPTMKPFVRAPLQSAAYRGRTQIVRMLLAAGARPDDVGAPNDQTPLSLAANGGHPELVELFVAAGADVNGAAADGRSFPPLVTAADSGCAPCVAHLLGAGAAIDRRDRNGRTALAFAVAQGHIEIVRTLLARGANPLIPSRDGRTAAYLSTHADRKPIYDLFVAAGVTDFELKSPSP